MNDSDGLPQHMLVGLTGLAGSGKDSCASLLQPLGFVQLAFADPLREEVCQAYGIDSRFVTDPVLKHERLAAWAVANCMNTEFAERMLSLGADIQEPRTARWVMQRWGTEYRRAQHGAYWIDKLVSRVARLRASGMHRIVVSDVRMPDEAACVIVLGGHLVRVQRPGNGAVMDAEARRHESEQHVDAFTVSATVVNGGTLADLSREVVLALDRLGVPAVPRPQWMTEPGAPC